MAYIKREIILINEETNERINFKSLNAAARFLGATFSNVQTAAVYNGIVKGWRVYESPETIRKHIKVLQYQLEYLEGGER